MQDHDQPAAELTDRHPATTSIIRHFGYGHLRTELQDVSAPVHHLAYAMLRELPDSPELTAGLRKLIEAKDCFVRARLEHLWGQEMPQ